MSGFKTAAVVIAVLAAAAGGGWYWKQQQDAGSSLAAGPAGAGKADTAASAGTPGAAPGGMAPAAGKADGARKGGPGADRNRPVPAVIDQVRVGDVPVLVNALGTVTARQQAVVRARVDGLLESLMFKEGAPIKKGQPLARLDPRPFEAALASVQGQLAKDQAQLDIAQLDLQRYRKLLAEDSIAAQQVDAQAALVKQLQGVITADKAAVATAQLNLSFATVTAPIAGRAGLRQVDPGNMVRSADANGIVVISEVSPITVVFSVPQESMGLVIGKFKEAEDKRAPIRVQALDRDGRTPLEGGRLLAIDNQTDPSTGSTRLKAVFANKSGKLFPGQFVNVRLVVDTLPGALTVPQSAIQRGAQGTFVFVVTPEKTASVRRVTLGNAIADRIVVSEGLNEGESVVIDGADKLREGAPVTTVSPVPSMRRRGGPGAAGAPAGPAAPAAAGSPPAGGAAAAGAGGAAGKAGADAAGAQGSRPGKAADKGADRGTDKATAKAGSDAAEETAGKARPSAGAGPEAGAPERPRGPAAGGTGKREWTPEQKAAFDALTPEQKEAIRNMTPEQRAALRARRAAREAGEADAAGTKP